MLVEILALTLALILLLFLFKHRFTKVKVRRSYKAASEQSAFVDKAVKSSAISEEMPVAPEYQTSSSHPYHCVEIVSEEGGCEHIRQYKGKRFLSKEAPALPLNECDKPNCHCHYLHHEDRRTQTEDRRVDFGVTRELYGVFGEVNRRQQPRKGRRASDINH